MIRSIAVEVFSRNFVSWSREIEASFADIRKWDRRRHVAEDSGVKPPDSTAGATLHRQLVLAGDNSRDHIPCR